MSDETDYRHLFLCLHERTNPQVIECDNGKTFVSCGDPACERWGGRTARVRHYHEVDKPLTPCPTCDDAGCELCRDPRTELSAASIIRVEPDDVLLLELPDDPTVEFVERVHTAMKGVWPHNDVVILPGDAHLSVLRPRTPVTRDTPNGERIEGVLLDGPALGRFIAPHHSLSDRFWGVLDDERKAQLFHLDGWFVLPSPEQREERGAS